MKQWFRLVIAAILIVTLPLFSFTASIRAEELTISGNGADSDSEINVTAETQTTIVQSNEAEINNNVNSTADTGGNETSGNTGGDTSVTTGDVTTITDITTSANSSTVSQECCPTPSTNIEISGNGAGSTNAVNIDKTNTTTVSVDQNAAIENNVNVSANSGDNEANDNTGSPDNDTNVSIDTGNISITNDIVNENINSASIQAAVAGESEISVKVSGNGADSENSVTITEENNTFVEVNNYAEVVNEVDIEANTGGNFANGNIGDVAITTGDIVIDTDITNGPINVSGVIISCCEVTPSPSPTPTPGPTLTPTPTPTPTPAPTSEGGGGGSSSSSSSSSPSGGPAGESAGSPAAGEVLGEEIGEVLAAAGNYWLIILTLFSILALTVGVYLRFGPDPEITIKRLKLFS